MNREERRHVTLVVGLQHALMSDGHEDPQEAFTWAVHQGLIKHPLSIQLRPLGVSIPERLMDIQLTERGLEYVIAWGMRQMEAYLVD